MDKNRIGQKTVYFTKPDTIYGRLAENSRASVKVRLTALKAMGRPSLSLLMRLLHDPAIPPRLYSLAASRYELELTRKDLRRDARRSKT